MAEASAFLDYNDGFVLHNGLPVKWIANTAELYSDYDLIIEQTNPDYAYEGFTIPFSYGTQSYTSSWTDAYGRFHKVTIPGSSVFVTPVAASAATNAATAGWGFSTAMIDGDVKINTYKKAPCSSIYKNGLQTSITGSSPKVPSEAFDTWVSGDLWNHRCSAAVRGYLYPKDKTHFFMGVKFGNEYGVPTNPDLTNHGNPAGIAAIHKLYAPNASSFLGMINASNYTAVKNVYAPNVTDVRMGLNHNDKYYGRPTVQTRLFENWYIPKARFLSGQSDSFADSAWSANIFADHTSANGITAKEISMNKLSQFENISGNGISAYSNSTYMATAKNVIGSSIFLRDFAAIENISASYRLSAGRIPTISGLSAFWFTVISAQNVRNVSSEDLTISYANDVSGVFAGGFNIGGVSSLNDVKCAQIIMQNPYVGNVNNVSAWDSFSIRAKNVTNFTGHSMGWPIASAHTFNAVSSDSLANVEMHIEMPLSAYGNINTIKVSAHTIDGLRSYSTASEGYNNYLISGNNSAHDIMISSDNQRDRAIFSGYSSITDVTANTIYVPSTAYTSGLSGEVIPY